MCGAHYARFKRGTDLTKPLRTYDPGKICPVEGCEQMVQSRGLCKMHAKRDLKYGDPNITKPQHWPAPGRGEQHHNWLGDKIGYKNAHLRVKRARGVPSNYPCAHCSAPAHDWAYDHTDPAPLIGEHRGSLLKYSGDPNYYIPLCTPCHKKFDKE